MDGDEHDMQQCACPSSQVCSVINPVALERFCSRHTQGHLLLIVALPNQLGGSRDPAQPGHNRQH